jgi:hypothetical protein
LTHTKNGRTKKTLVAAVIVTAMFAAQNANGQNNAVIIQQNSNTTVIERPVYIERYRTVYVNKPQPKRVARKLPKPIQLLGYLWVYPEDLGTFKQQPLGVIQSINTQNMYGRNNWRIPTPDELAVLENNANTVGLGDDIYLATDHANGVLRLVSTGKTTAERRADKQLERQKIISSGKGIEIDGTVWAKQNVTLIDGENRFGWRNINSYIPKGWRLPNENEIVSLVRTFDNNAEKLAEFFGVAAKGENAVFWLTTNNTHEPVGMMVFMGIANSRSLPVKFSITTDGHEMQLLGLERGERGSGSARMRCVLAE